MSDDVVPEVEADASVCFPVQDAGFSYRKSYKRINKKLTGAIASRLKTNFTRALLKENACDDRKLDCEIQRLSHHQAKIETERKKRKASFEIQQERRRQSWHKDDCFSVERLNLPYLPSANRKLISPSTQSVYRPAERNRPIMTVPLCPVKEGSPEQKIVAYENQTYLTKEPARQALPSRQWNWYNKYRGVQLLHSRSVMDCRFQLLSESLCTVKKSVNLRGKTHEEIITPIKQSYTPTDMKTVRELPHKTLIRASTTYM